MVTQGGSREPGLSLVAISAAWPPVLPFCVSAAPCPLVAVWWHVDMTLARDSSVDGRVWLRGCVGLWLGTGHEIGMGKERKGFHFDPPCPKGGVLCLSEGIDISPGNLDSSLGVSRPSVSHDGLCV